MKTFFVIFAVLVLCAGVASAKKAQLRHDLNENVTSMRCQQLPRVQQKTRLQRKNYQDLQCGPRVAPSNFLDYRYYIRRW